MKNLIAKTLLIGGLASLSLLNSGCERYNQEKRRIKDLNAINQEIITLNENYINAHKEYIKKQEEIHKSLDSLSDEQNSLWKEVLFLEKKINVYKKIKIQNTDSIKIILKDRNKDTIIDEVNYMYYFPDHSQKGVYSADEDYNGLFETTMRISEGKISPDLREFKKIHFNDISQCILKYEPEGEYRLK